MRLPLLFIGYFCLPLGFVVLCPNVAADVINPTLIEFSAYENGEVVVELALNIEAILSNSTVYKNSKDSPYSDQYDKLRKQTPLKIKQTFLANLAHFLAKTKLVLNGEEKSLYLVSLVVADIGYQGRPRVSKLVLKTKTTKPLQKVLWYYNKQYGDYVYRSQFYQAGQYNWSAWQWVRDGTISFDFKIAKIKSQLGTALEYMLIGFWHIFPRGLDHILFIIGIALLALSWQKLLTMVTIFTLAHSTTLLLAIYGVLKLSPSVVEPLIALSIAYIGIENLRSPSHLYRCYGIIFIFGLLHGLGFAAVLSNFDLKTHTFTVSLIGFNVGVEIGQVLIITLVLVLLWLMNKTKLETKTYLINPVAIIISAIGLLWTIERVWTAVGTR